MNNVQENPIDLMAIVRVLLRNILLIALVAILVGSAAFGYSAFVLQPEYRATASLYVNSSSFNLGATNFSITSSDLATSDSLVSVYLYILKSRTTMEEVIKAADLTYTPSQLSGMISAQGVASVGAFEVTVTSSNPTEVELIANTIAKILPVRISEIVDGTSVRIVDYAIIPARRSGPDIVQNTITGMLLGAVGCSALIVLFSMLTDRSSEMIKSADDIRALYPDMMVLAMIPDMRQSNKNSYYSSYYGPTENKKKGGKRNGGSQEAKSGAAGPE